MNRFNLTVGVDSPRGSAVCHGHEEVDRKEREVVLAAPSGQCLLATITALPRMFYAFGHYCTQDVLLHRKVDYLFGRADRLANDDFVVQVQELDFLLSSLRQMKKMHTVPITLSQVVRSAYHELAVEEEKEGSVRLRLTEEIQTYLCKLSANQLFLLRPNTVKATEKPCAWLSDEYIEDLSSKVRWLLRSSPRVAISEFRKAYDYIEEGDGAFVTFCAILPRLGAFHEFDGWNRADILREFNALWDDQSSTFKAAIRIWLERREEQDVRDRIPSNIIQAIKRIDDDDSDVE